MKDKNWTDIVSKQGDLRHFASMAIRKSGKSESDRRSYCIRITGAGKDEIDRMYYYYLDPLYTLQKNMKKEKFETLFQLIREANEILSSQKK